MRLVIDLQGAQTKGSRQRGIGRYSLAIAQALARNNSGHDVHIALNGLFPETLEPLRAAFAHLLPSRNIHVWETPGPVSQDNPANAWRRKAGEKVREAFLLGLEPDVVLVSSLFEGFEDDAVTGIGALSLSIPTAVILYDLIPYIYPEAYLAHPPVKGWYLGKIGHLRRAHQCLCISRSSRQEVLDLLGFPPPSAVAISTAADAAFRPRKIASQEERAVRVKYGVDRPFVMYTGGFNFRKNLEGLIRAFARLPFDLHRAHQLVIVCALEPESRQALQELARKHGLPEKSLVLTGFVPEEDLVLLYSLCKLFVFPSWHEGFGLPALEAMSCGAPVIGSDRSSIPEVIGREDALFNPHQDESIAQKMREVLTDESFRRDLARHGLAQAQKFSWDMTAQKALEAMEDLHDRTNFPRGRPFPIGRRPRLAYVSPLPPERSGIAEYSAELIPELSTHYEVDAVVAQKEVDTPAAHACRAVIGVDRFMRRASTYDRIVYHLGNSPFHRHMFALVEKFPGTVVLHDFYLSDVLGHCEAQGDPPHAFARALYGSHGYGALKERFHQKDRKAVHEKYPCNFNVLKFAKGVIAHSSHPLSLAREWYGEGLGNRWASIPLLRAPLQTLSRQAARARLGLGPDDFIVCSFGLLVASKESHRMVEAWSASRLAEDQKCRLIFVGQNEKSPYGRSLERKIQNSPGANPIQVTGWVGRETYGHYLAAADLAIQLRSRSRGETSAAVLDAMNQGLPVVVNACGSMGELPPDTVHMLPETFTRSQLTEALEVLYGDPSRRQGLGDRARRRIRTHHGPRRCAEQYAQALENFHEKTRVRDTLLESLSLLEEDPPSSKDLKALAQCIAWNLPFPRPAPQLLVDISSRTGKPHDTRQAAMVDALLRNLLEDPPQGFRVEPVHAPPGSWAYRYARKFTLNFLECPTEVLEDAPMEYAPGDLFVLLEAPGPRQEPFLERLRWHGVAVQLPSTVQRGFSSGVAPAGVHASSWEGKRQGLDKHQLLVDLSALHYRDARTGIQRVVRNILSELFASPPPGYLVMPIFGDGETGVYRYAPRFLPEEHELHGRLDQRPVSFKKGDIFFGLDLSAHLFPAAHDTFEAFKKAGVAVHFMVYDIIPLRYPQYTSAAMPRLFRGWIEALARHGHTLICISGAVARDVEDWLQNHLPHTPRPRIVHCHLGSDLEKSMPTQGVPPEGEGFLEDCRSHPTFLMVGTVEPRKGHGQVLDAFEKFWDRNVSVRLVIVGKEGWNVEPLVKRLRKHPEKGRRLFWLDSVSDEYLEKIYGAATCLVAASVTEGFGLPLIEAARHHLPVMARDIPVFREVAGDHAFYFQGDEPERLAEAIEEWMELHRRGEHPDSTPISGRTWKECAHELKSLLLETKGA